MANSKVVAVRLSLADYAALQSVPGQTDSAKMRNLVQQQDLVKKIATSATKAVERVFEMSIPIALDQLKDHVTTTASALDAREQQRVEMLAELLQGLAKGGIGS